MKYMGIMRLLLSLPLLLQMQILAIRQYCYSGSDLYQNTIQDCVEQDPSYNGTWWCAKMTICEAFKPSSRECIQTKGCAKATECNTTTQKSYGGMTIKSNCCLNTETFADDDTLAVEVAKICNGATSRYSNSITTFISIIMISAFALRHILH